MDTRNNVIALRASDSITKNRLVNVSGTGTVAQIDALSDAPLGVALNGGAAGATIYVQTRGRCYVGHTAVAITAGDTVGVDTAGRAVGKSLTLNPETVTIGTCLETSSDVLDENALIDLNIIQRDSSQRVMLAGTGGVTAGHAVTGTGGASNDALPLAATDSIPLGVALNTAAENETVIVQVAGVVRMKATNVAQVQGAITGYTAAGRAAALVSGGAHDNYPLGHNLTTTTGVLDDNVIVALSIGGVQA
jgi:hypothetical protein